MKHLFKTLSWLLLLGTLACDNEKSAEPSAKEKLVIALSDVAWGEPTVSHADDGDLSDMYTDFVIQWTINASEDYDGTYVVNAGGNAFPNSQGSWKLNNDLSQITLSSGQTIDFEILENTLTLDFTVPSQEGRMAGVDGHFTFELSAL